MTTAAYTVDAFVADMRTIAAECTTDQDIIVRLRPFAERLGLATDWLKPEHYVCDDEQGFGVHLLHQEPDHTLAVFAIAWLPGRGAPPHNHGTWAVVSGVDGIETNLFWKRLDNGDRKGYAEVVKNGERAFGPGEVVCFLPHEIHSVQNDTEHVTVSLHIYGKHLNFTGRSQFDVEHDIEAPFIIKEQ